VTLTIFLESLPTSYRTHLAPNLISLLLFSAWFARRILLVMENYAAWAAVVISVCSACIAIGAAWINIEKLRLDLYDRRFGVYEKTLTLHTLVSHWSSDASESETGQLKEPPELKEARLNFPKTLAESRFLFSSKSGVAELLQQFYEDVVVMVRYRRLHNPRHPEAYEKSHDAYVQSNLRFLKVMEPLRERMARFLNFHSYSALPRLRDDDAGDWL
jgi:hypothetical protein